MPEFLEGRSYEHPLGLNLYGLYQNKNAIQKQRKAIIVEGEKSLIAFMEIKALRLQRVVLMFQIGN